MQRRRFIRVTGLSAASLFFLRTDPRSGETGETIGFPSYVSILSAGQWITLQGSRERWTGRATVLLDHVTGPAIGGREAIHVLRVQVSAPGISLEKIRIGWNRVFDQNAKFLGDDWERSYGGLEWKGEDPQRKAPWYLLRQEGEQTHAVGIRTGAGSIGYWQASGQQLQLFLDTSSGGGGVRLDDRV